MDELLSRLADDPERAALLLDVDGTLAPIVPRPEDARVPQATRAELRRLHARYALVACISGRTSTDARDVVGVPELVYVGNHGLELEPDAEEWAERLRVFMADVDWPDLVEDKRLSVSLHYRNVPEARGTAELIAERARAAGLDARFGRRVLELLPPISANKGTAVRRLLDQRGLARALYAGDDTTDLDAFTALDAIEFSVRVAVGSSEGPVALTDAADIVVTDPDGFLDVLRRL